jgi:Kef-type K+ transport system membrane component KefB
MEEPGFSGLLIVVAVAFAAPFLLGLTPRLRLPSVVFEIVAGIIIGPSVLGWVEVDETISVLALMGLAILLFLAGLEIDFGRLRGRLLWLALLGWGLSFVIAVVVSQLLKAAGLVETPLLVAIILCATSLGLIIPVLKDVGELTSKFGQLVLAAASIADFGGSSCSRSSSPARAGRARPRFCSRSSSCCSRSRSSWCAAPSGRDGSRTISCACRTRAPKSASARRWSS